MVFVRRNPRKGSGSCFRLREPTNRAVSRLQIILEDPAHVSQEVFLDLGASHRPVDSGGEESLDLPDIPAHALVEDRVHRLLLQKQPETIRKLYLALVVGPGVLEAREDGRREEVSSDDC